MAPRDFNWNDDLSLTRKGMGPLVGAPLATPPPETPPPVAEAGKSDPARYRLGSRLGRSGQVYEAQSDRFPGRVAVKLLPFAAGLPPGAVRSFTQEATRVAELRHPHIVAVLTASVFAEGTPFMAMERLAGETLEDRVARLRVFTLAEVLPVVRGLASALSAAHAIGVVHREIRTDNVFISDLPGYGIGFARLLDFGVSRLTAAARDAGRIVAPAAWRVLAPELQQGQQAALGDRGWQALMEHADERTDQFALAAMTYRLLAGTEPIAGQEVGTAFERLHDERSERCPAAVDVVLCKALSRRPEQRYDSMALFFRAFEEACADALASERGGVPAPRQGAERSPVPRVVRAADEEETRPAIAGIEPATRPAAPASADAPTVVSWPSGGAPRPSPDATADTTPGATARATAGPRPVPERASPGVGDGPSRSASMAASPGSLTQQFFADGDRQEADWLKGLARRHRTGADHGVGDRTNTSNTSSMGSASSASSAGSAGSARTYGGTDDFLDLSASFDRPDAVPRRRAPLIAGAVAATLLGFAAVGWAVGLWSPGAWLADHTAPSFQPPPTAAPPVIAPPTPAQSPAKSPPKATVASPITPPRIQRPAAAAAPPAAAPPAATAPPAAAAPPAATAVPERTAAAPAKAPAPEATGIGAPLSKKDPLRGMAWSANRRRMIRSKRAPVPSESSPPPQLSAPAVPANGAAAPLAPGWPPPAGIPAADNPPPPLPDPLVAPQP